MKALGLTKFGKPTNLEILTLPDPVIESPEDIIVSVKAISVNPADYVRMSGITRFVEPITPPFTIAADFSGVIFEVGESVTKFKKGDKVYGFCIHVHGTASQLLHLTPKTGHFISHIPSSPTGTLSIEEAAAIPVACCTAISALWQADRLIALKESSGSRDSGGLVGKTVFVTAGLGGIGSSTLQILKSCFEVKKVITTVSTSKIPLVDELLGEGKVDLIVDYTKGQNDVVEKIGKETVDFLFDTVGQGMGVIEVMKKGGLILNTKGKSSTTLRAEVVNPPFWICWLVDLHLAVQRWRAGRYGVEYDHTHTQFGDRFGDAFRGWVEEGKLRPIVGRLVEFEKGKEEEGLQEVKAVLEMAGKGKGAVGKMVVRLDGFD
ncbi:uncharacterized protein PAC_00181 [Phialocephala subalpina]|uniref:Enoyl reductase (ER) domain-containing protein n=1 Tax=Phialocephala subalpina TaxID=576137 RepID=A0A1L7WCB6_9HELO|nr:uncharacterized protein PAC_00181 [Phialocephala subalpina]